MTSPPLAAPAGGAPAATADADLPPDLRDVGLATCWRLLADARRVRVAYTSGALPALAVVPVVLDGASLVVLTPQGSPLARAAHGGVVAAQADGSPPPLRSVRSPADATATEWSVTVTGRAEEVLEVDEALAAAMARTGVHRRLGEVLVRVHADLVEGQLL